MKMKKFNNLILGTLVAVLFLGLIQVQAQTTKTIKVNSKLDDNTETQTKAIEKIVRNYLLKNPSIIREAMQALEIKEAKEKAELAASNLKRLKNDIFADPNSPTSGNEKAEVSIVAFFDYNCGYCKSSLPMLNELLAKDPSIRIVYKEFPILSQSSQLGAKAALAAQIQGKYLEFHNALVVAEEISGESIKTIADQLGLDYEKLQTDMNDEKTNEYIKNNYKLAADLSIQGTPAYIVGTQIIPGAVDINTLTNIVEQERTKLLNAATVAKIPTAQ